MSSGYQSEAANEGGLGNKISYLPTAIFFSS